MESSIQKWGNSRGIRIPKTLLKVLGWSESENVSVSTMNGEIFIKKAEEQHHHPTINELFEGYEGEYVTERYSWGEKAGREVW